MEEEEDDPRAAQLDPPFPYRIRPVDWAWLREPRPQPAEEAEESPEEV